ncbi:MAG: T9SS type A sorting domain-containing protein [Bacteroidales bacterium]|nr:T9SS type A sorting domain-containing protein [Bacteroidales bacterium]
MYSSILPWTGPIPSTGYDVSQAITIYLINSLGIQLDERKVMPVLGSARVEMDLTGYEPGIYFVKISNGDSVCMEKIVIH